MSAVGPWPTTPARTGTGSVTGVLRSSANEWGRRHHSEDWGWHGAHSSPNATEMQHSGKSHNENNRVSNLLIANGPDFARRSADARPREYLQKFVEMEIKRRAITIRASGLSLDFLQRVTFGRDSAPPPDSSVVAGNHALRSYTRDSSACSLGDSKLFALNGPIN